MDFSRFVPPPDDLDDCIGLACSLDVRSSCHATMTRGSFAGCLGPLCGLRRLTRGGLTWLDVSCRRLVYRETKVDLAEEEFILLAATAAGHGEFVSFDALANTVLGEAQTDDPVKCVLAWVNTIHSRLRSLGVLEDIVEIDMHAGLRLAESFGP